ncbi:hypothetical protein H0H92_003421 [Tricholoma furcatifolium]|nr:hypothetical protein H0H92_003421 [Tricholoma furcatifolium]
MSDYGENLHPESRSLDERTSHQGQASSPPSLDERMSYQEGKTNPRPSSLDDYRGEQALRTGPPSLDNHPEEQTSYPAASNLDDYQDEQALSPGPPSQDEAREEHVSYQGGPSAAGTNDEHEIDEKDLRFIATINEMNAQTPHISDVPPTSSSAWTPLLRKHMEEVLPVIDRWRGTLDTSLIFVRLVFKNEFIALFSAIVTTFFVQTLPGLTENPAVTTNQLIANLTDIILLLHGEDAAALKLRQPTPFAPEPVSIRTCLWWSLALTLSVHQKLTDLQAKWKEGEVLLGHATEWLPRCLLFPVGLFLIGLLDRLVVAADPLSGPTVAIFVAGIASCVCGFGIPGIYAVNILKRCPSIISDSFLPTFLRPSIPTKDDKGFARRNTPAETIFAGLRKALRWLRFSTDGPNSRPSADQDSEKQQISIETTDSSNALHIDDGELMEGPLLTHEHRKAFHIALSVTHEVESLDQAVTALHALIVDIKRAAIFGESPEVTGYEVRTFQHLLSMDASAWCNIATAEAIMTSVDYDLEHHIPALHYSPESMMIVIEALCLASKRNTVAKKTMAMTIVLLLESITHGINSKSDSNRRALKALCKKSPFLALLFVSGNEVYFGNSAAVQTLRSQVVKIAYEGLLTDMSKHHNGDQDELLDSGTLLGLLVRVLQEQGLTMENFWLFQQSAVAADALPFLLGLLPMKIGSNILYRNRPSELSSCFLAVLQSIFTASISELSPSAMVQLILDVIDYHRTDFQGSPIESLDLFLVTATCLDAIRRSAVDFAAVGFVFVADACMQIVEWAYSPKNLHLSRTHGLETSPPRLVQQAIIDILRDIDSRFPRRPYLSQAIFPREFHDFLFGIQTDLNDYNADDRQSLIEAFGLLDRTILGLFTIDAPVIWVPLITRYR